MGAIFKALGDRRLAWLKCNCHKPCTSKYDKNSHFGYCAWQCIAGRLLTDFAKKFEWMPWAREIKLSHRWNNVW